MTNRDTRPAPTPSAGPAQRVEFRYRVSIWSANFVSWFFFLLPPPLRLAIADLFAHGFYRFSSTYRDNVQTNLRQVLGPDADRISVRRSARSVFRTSARNFLDLILVPRRSRKTLIEAVHLSDADRQILDDAIATGKGVVIVTAHLGAFDYIGQGLHLLGYRLTIVTGKTVSRYIFDGVTYLRGAKGASLVEPTPSGVRKALQALRRGECVAFVADRDYFMNGKTVEFFGRETTLPPGAVRIARDTGAPIVPIFTRRVPGGHAMTIFPPLHVERTKDQDADVTRGLQQLVPVLEEAIGAAPEQWVMFQRVWRDAPVDPVRAFPVGSPFAPESASSRVAARLRSRSDASPSDPN